MKLKKLARQVWNSPTLTSWASILTQALRLLAVTPLILTKLAEHESASWLLFANLSFVGVIISGQLQNIFSSMLSFAMGGASDLGAAAIERNRNRKGDGEPNWNSFERAFGTLRWLQAGNAIGNLLLAGTLGYFALGNFLSEIANPGPVWASFGVLLVTGFIGTALGNYQTALVGMNKVAMSNRWGILSSLASVLAGFLTLSLGGGIFWTTLNMQAVSLLNLIRVRWLARTVEGGAISRFHALRFDREIFRSAWPSLWKQAIVAFAGVGFVQGIGVLFSFTGSAAAVGGYFLLLRLSNTVNHIAHAPFASVAPRFSRSIAAGKRDEIVPELLQRFRFSLGIYIFGMFGITFVAPWLLELIGSNIGLPGTIATAIYCCFGCYAKYFSLAQHITSLGNKIVQYWERLAASLIGLLLVALLMPRYGVLGLIIGFVVPYPFLFRLRAIKLASDYLGISASRMLKIGILPGAYILLVAAYLVLSYGS